jgi:hypothetical protein
VAFLLVAISTYAELEAAVASWLHRDDLTLVIPDFIRLAEVRLNRVLRTRPMLTEFASVALVDGAATLPDGFLAFKELRCDTSPSYTLASRPLEWIRNQPATSAAPLYYALTGDEVICWPQSGSIVGTYYAEIPDLATNSTNWLLTNHPDLYLFAALTESALFTQDDSRIPLWAEKTSALIEQVKGTDIADAINGGPLTARAR